MDVHGFVVFVAGILVNESRTKTLDLYTSTRLLLDIFDKHTLHEDESRIKRPYIRHTEGPTTLARTLKFLIVSIPTGIFSSGHLRYTNVNQTVVG